MGGIYIMNFLDEIKEKTKEIEELQLQRKNAIAAEIFIRKIDIMVSAYKKMFNDMHSYYSYSPEQIVILDNLEHIKQRMMMIFESSALPLGSLEIASEKNNLCFRIWENLEKGMRANSTDYVIRMFLFDEIEMPCYKKIYNELP